MGYESTKVAGAFGFWHCNRGSSFDSIRELALTYDAALSLIVKRLIDPAANALFAGLRDRHTFVSR